MRPQEPGDAEGWFTLKANLIDRWLKLVEMVFPVAILDLLQDLRRASTNTITESPLITLDIWNLTESARGYRNCTESL